MNVGLCEGGVPVLGVVSVPGADEPRTYMGVKGVGSFVEVHEKLLAWALDSCPGAAER